MTIPEFWVWYSILGVLTFTVYMFAQGWNEGKLDVEMGVLAIFSAAAWPGLMALGIFMLVYLLIKNIFKMPYKLGRKAKRWHKNKDNGEAW